MSLLSILNVIEMKQIFFAVLFLISFDGYAQNCEAFDRELFHILPNKMPDEINCLDSNGQRQGWWIIYQKYFSDKTIPYQCVEGYNVDRYSFGQYKDNKRVGDWEYIENVHLVYPKKIEHYSYYKDSMSITTTRFMSDDKIVMSLKEDSKIIRYTFQNNQEYPITIFCNKKSKNDTPCSIIYRNEVFKQFPIEELDFQVDNYDHLYQRERILIDRKRTKQ